uniref:CCHC-type domain-containing protein n=1 Tax=Tanacetum cinerariifolium TaxID=118510 RepID=A0A6L2NB32_TANCI|nr:hypothetical protein [Tanacetum cinerariifolium]
MNMSPENKDHFLAEKEAIHLILTGIGDEIYSIVDACQTAKEMWEAIERLQQGESLNIQDVKTNLFWEFEWSRFVTIVKQQHKLDEVSYHKLFDILKQYQNEVNELRAERLARNANPLALVATAHADQDQYYQTSKSHKSHTPSSKPSIPTRSHASTRHKGKEIAKPITPPSKTASKEDNDPEQAQRDKDMQKNLALIGKYFKKIYKPTNNNIRTSSNSKNKNVDTTPRFKNDNQSGQFGNQRMINVAAARENVGSKVVHQSGIQCFNCKEYGHFAKECRKPKRVKDSAYHKEKILLCEQAGQGVSLLRHRFRASGIESDDERVALANLIANLKLDVDENKKIQKQLKKANITLAQELKECKAILAETSKSLGESISVRDSCLVALQTKQTEFKKYKAFNDRTVDYDKLKHKLNEALGQLAQKDTIIREASKVSTYNGRPTFANPRYLKQAQSEIPYLYAFPYDQNTHANRLIPDGEETLALERESQSKLNKDLVRPYDYTTLNSLYEIFKPPTQEEINELESDKAEFSDMYDVILQECVSKDVMCSYLQSFSNLNALAELQWMYLHKVKECDCLAQKLSKQTESVSKKVHTESTKNEV